jgi:hypothetical protein
MKLKRIELRRLILLEIHAINLTEGSDDPDTLFSVVKEFLIKAKGGWSPTYWKTLADLLGTDGLSDEYKKNGTKGALQMLNQRYDELA